MYPIYCIFISITTVFISHLNFLYISDLILFMLFFIIPYFLIKVMPFFFRAGHILYLLIIKLFSD